MRQMSWSVQRDYGDFPVVLFKRSSLLLRKSILAYKENTLKEYKR
jgi:hypothetical protein